MFVISLCIIIIQTQIYIYLEETRVPGEDLVYIWVRGMVFDTSPLSTLFQLYRGG